MAQIEHITTADQLFGMPDDGYRHELRYGELRRMSPPGARHGWIAARVAARLNAYAELHDLGVVLVETGFLLSRDPDLVRGPDVSFVRRGRVPADGLPLQYWPGAPDVAFEVVSPDDTDVEVKERADDLLRHGTGMVVVIEPDRLRVAVHHSARDVRILTEDDEFEGGDVLPGFRLAVRDLFTG
jgi:Uma2 family endonuclease